MTCREPGCEMPARQYGMCWGHRKRQTRKTGSGPIARRPSNAFERLTEAAIAYADGLHDDDEDQFHRARDNLRKSASAYSPSHSGMSVREALAARKARGEPVGRPPKLTHARAAEEVMKAGSIRRAAARLGVSRVTIRRALRTGAGQKDSVSDPP